MNDYQRYYVYLHVDPRNGEIVYVGMGKLGRAWQMRFSGRTDSRYGQRSKEHYAWYLELDSLGFLLEECVKIHAKCLSKQEARAIEEKLILKLRPKYNKEGNPEYKKPSIFSQETRDFVISLREMGYSYTHISFLCGAESSKSRENTKTMTIWRMINAARNE